MYILEILVLRCTCDYGNGKRSLPTLNWVSLGVKARWKIFYRKRKYLFDACRCEGITNATVNKTSSRFRVRKYFIPASPRSRKENKIFCPALRARVSELNTPILGSEKHLRIKRGFNFRARAFIRYSQYGSAASTIAIDINIAA